MRKKRTRKGEQGKEREEGEEVKAGKEKKEGKERRSGKGGVRRAEGGGAEREE